MEASIQQLYDIGAVVEQVAAEMATKANQSVDEFNEVFDQLEAANERIAILEKNAKHDWEVMGKQEAVIAAAILATQKDRSDLNLANAQFKELQRLDPKRLSKQNKGYKTTIATLKELNGKLETARKAAVKHAKTVNTVAKTEGNATFHFDPESKNAIRVIPTLFVSKTNEFNGVVGSPVIEFIHHGRGVSRQGTLLNDGTVGWANAKNSTPTKDESRIAREFIYTWCKQNKIKYQEAA